MNTIDALLTRLDRSGPLRAARLAALRLVCLLNRLTAARVGWLLAITALLALQLALIVTHSPWRDEWQALQIAVLSDWRTLWVNLRYEGHPPLWYLILRGIASLVGPARALPVAVAMLALPAQLVILLRAPFRRGERLLLTGSAFLLFEFFTVSRSLTLGVALIVFALAIWRTRWSWLAIALLPMADFLFGVISGVLMLRKWRERALWWPGIGLWLAMSTLSGWLVRPAADEIPAAQMRGVLVEATSYLQNLGLLALPLQWHGRIAWDAPLPPLLAPFGWIAFLAIAWAFTKGRKFDRLLLLGYLCFALLFSCFVYGLSARHTMLGAIMLIALQWLARADGRAFLRGGWSLWLAGAAACGMAMAVTALTRPFDSDRIAAHEIVARNLQGEHWMSYPAWQAQGISAQLGIAFERPNEECTQSYIRWNSPTIESNDREFAAYLRAEVARHGKFFLLSDRELRLPAGLARQLADIPAGIDRQKYVIYEIGPTAARRVNSLEPCVSGQSAPAAWDRPDLGKNQGFRNIHQ